MNHEVTQQPENYHPRLMHVKYLLLFKLVSIQVQVTCIISILQVQNSNQCFWFLFKRSRTHIKIQDEYTHLINAMACVTC